MSVIVKEGTLLWEPSTSFKKQTNIANYMEWLKNKHLLSFHQYDELWDWSVTNTADFWGSLWEYFDIQYSKPYRSVITDTKMPGTKWFEEAELNFAQHIFRNIRADQPAIISQSEIRPLEEMSWEILYQRVASFAAGLKDAGVQKGDRVVAYTPNIPESVIAFLSCASIGAIWSSCSPDFGSAMVIDRFKQIEPTILVAVDGYRYNGKVFDRMETVGHIEQAIPSLKKTIVLPYLHHQPDISNIENAVLWSAFINKYENATLEYEQVAFDHPLWVLFSSGTTGLPKPIVQGQGGILLEHLKICTFHLDLKPDDRFFWFSTTGWMMWNLLVGGLLTGSTIVLYDGSPGYPDLNRMWKFAEDTNVTVFGTSASYLLSCRDNEISPKRDFNLSALKSIGSTGSPLPPEGFAWVYEQVKQDMWLVSTSGGTDLCTAFVGGTPILPVHAGEMQSISLGAEVQAFDETGNGVINQLGELVLTKPMPSMPIYFWNDHDNERYYNSYFNLYPGIWRHGDWIKITDRGSCQIYGRSDSTINRGGIRMGTSEIYSAVEKNSSIKDSLVIDISNAKGAPYMPLFVVVKEGAILDASLKQELKQQIRINCSPRHIPDQIYEINEVPKTLNGKKLEVPVKNLLMGKSVDKSVSKDALSNPKSLEYFIQFAQDME